MGRLLTHETSLLERGDHTRFGGRRDDGHRVALIMSPLQHLVGSWALDAALGELLRDFIKLTRDERILLFIAHLEVVLLHESLDHAAEVHAHEVGEEAIDVVLLHDLVGEVGAGFEGETLRLAESVVTVEEDIFDL